MVGAPRPRGAGSVLDDAPPVRAVGGDGGVHHAAEQPLVEREALVRARRVQPRAGRAHGAAATALRAIAVAIGAAACVREAQVAVDGLGEHPRGRAVAPRAANVREAALKLRRLPVVV